MNITLLATAPQNNFTYMKNKIKIFFEFNKQKVIIALFYSLFLSIIKNYYFRYSFTDSIAANTVFSTLVFPIESLYLYITTLVPFFNLGNMDGSVIYKLLLSIFSSVFMLFFQYFYYYLVACFIFLFKNKIKCITKKYLLYQYRQ